MTAAERTIRARDLIRVFARSFLIQASWSFDRMQSLGFAYAMQPALRRVYPDPDEYRARMGLHMEYFNTQPYLASFILGATVRLEEDRALGAGDQDIAAFKNTLMAPLGALGDSFFWGALKPLAACIAAALVLAGVWWGPLLFLVIYNSIHVWVRADMLVLGYESRGDVVQLMSRYRFTKLARLFKVITLAVLGGIIGMVPIWRSELKPLAAVPGPVIAAAGLMLTMVLVVILRKGGSPVKLMLGLAAASVALAYAGVVL